MPTQRLSMRRIKQLLTMRFGAGASTREIARELGVAPSTVREYLGRAAAAGIGWPLAADVTDESLMARLFVNAGVRAGARFHAEPDWSAHLRTMQRFMKMRRLTMAREVLLGPLPPLVALTPDVLDAEKGLQAESDTKSSSNIAS